MASKTLTQQRFDSLVKDHVWPLLKSAGFKKQGLNFRRRWGELGEGGWHVINIQKSQWSNRDFIRFTINLGVASDLYTRFEAKDPARPPTASECCWNIRIGRRLPAAHDEWWDIDASRRFTHPAEEVVWALSELALPALDKLGSVQGITKSLAKIKPGKYTVGWDWNSMVKAVFLRGQPRELARLIAALRAAHSDTPENRKWIEAKIRRLRAKW